MEADADVRRRANLAALKDTPQKAALADAFIKAWFLTAEGGADLQSASLPEGQDSTDGLQIRATAKNATATVSLAHEALLRKWDRVAQWVRDNRQHLRIHSRVEMAMRRWQSRDQHQSLLLSEGLDLEKGLSLIKDAPQLLAGSEYDAVRDYIECSFRHHERRERRTR